MPGREALAVRVVDAGSGEPLPARIVVRDAAGKVVESRYEHLAGVFTDERGMLEMPLRPGAYSLEVQRGIDFLSKELAFDVRPGVGAEATVPLEPWLRLREMGWANGDAHAHLYSDTSGDPAMLATVRRICRAQGVDFLCACQTWAGYAGEGWRDAFAAHSDTRFRLLYGAEMPKYRTGHTFWFGLDSTRGLFDDSMDVTYENAYYQSPSGSGWTFDSLPFPAIPDIELVSRLRAAEDAVAVVPHPTSWWWQKRGESEKYVTNVAVSLSAGLLAGGAWGAMVVMGYDRDQDFYQDLWFHVLDEGYRMAPVGELDGGYGPDGRFYYGSVRTYAKVGKEIDRSSLVRAVRSNHTFVTSGPIVLARLGGEYEPGDVVPADGRARELRVRAFASGDRRDRLTYVVLFRNGRIHRLWDLRGRSPRRFVGRIPLREKSDAWYVLKAYSGNATRTPEQLDVRANAERIAAGGLAGLAARRRRRVPHQPALLPAPGPARRAVTPSLEGAAEARRSGERHAGEGRHGARAGERTHRRQAVGAARRARGGGAGRRRAGARGARAAGTPSHAVPRLPPAPRPGGEARQRRVARGLRRSRPAAAGPGAVAGLRVRGDEGPAGRGGLDRALASQRAGPALGAARGGLRVIRGAAAAAMPP